MKQGKRSYKKVHNVVVKEHKYEKALQIKSDLLQLNDLTPDMLAANQNKPKKRSMQFRRMTKVSSMSRRKHSMCNPRIVSTL